MRDEYIKQAQKVIPDPNILINVVSRRVKQLKYGQKPLVESLERLSPEDIALILAEAKAIRRAREPPTPMPWSSDSKSTSRARLRASRRDVTGSG